MLLEEDILFFNRHSPQVVWLKGFHNLQRLSIFLGVWKDKLCLHGSDSVRGFLLLMVTSIIEEQMLTCSRKFTSGPTHVA